MQTAHSSLKTAHASRYLQQLCKHFSHKVSVEFDAHEGRADLPAGPVVLTAGATALSIQVTSDDADSLNRAKSVVEDHLLRFAFRESPAALEWSA